MAETNSTHTEALEDKGTFVDVKNRERCVYLAWDDVASKLLQDKLLLTALELHTELAEAGFELPRLRDYFSNPSNFEQNTSKTNVELQSSAQQGGQLLPRSSSQTTLDSLDWGHLSEDGERAVDERVAVLEFELRKARETIQGLRTNLTQATESKPSSVEKQEADKTSMVAALSSIRPHEKRTLNFLINEYLVTNSYKLTAITFADENDDQDFEHWDDVGLNTSRPPNLVQMLREGGHSIANLTSCACQTDGSTDISEDIRQYQIEVERLQKELEVTKDILASQSRELKKLHRKTSTPSVTPLGSPRKESAQCQNEGFPCDSDKVNLLAVDKGGRESPEGTSDNEETSGGGGFVIISPPSVLQVAQTTGCSSAVLQENIEQIFHQDPVRSGYEDPSESIEVLIQSGSEDTLDKISERLSEAMDIKIHATGEESSVTQEISSQDIQTSPDDIPDVVSVTEYQINQELQSSYQDSIEGSSKISRNTTTEAYLKQIKCEAKNLLRASSRRIPPDVFEEQLIQTSLGHTNYRESRVQAEVARLGEGGQELLEIVASSLHNIAPNVILAKREELLPLLICGVCLHKDGREREKLLHLLFNLIKRPNEEQRNIILTGLVGLARVLGPTKLEAELLPQCWEQLTHKYIERRLLVAQSTAALAPYTPPSLRNSLLLSMLLQLLAPGGEKDVKVREVALLSLSLLVTYLDDCSKLSVLVDTLLHCLENSGATTDASPHISLDSSQFATRPLQMPLSAIDTYLSSLAVWALEENSINLLLDPLIAKLQQLACHFKDTQETEKNRQVSQQPVVTVIEAIRKVIPFIMATLINSLPVPDDVGHNFAPMPSSCTALEELSIIYGSKEKALLGLNQYQQYVAKEWFKSWEELDYITKMFLPALIEVLAIVEATTESAVHAFIKLFTELLQCLGPQISSSCVKPIFMRHLSLDDSALEVVSQGNTGLTRSLVVVYSVAVIAPNQSSSEKQGELESFLAKQINILALCRAQLDSLYITIATLLQHKRNHDAVLGSLWSCVVHKSSMVRACSAGLWGIVVGCVEDGALGSRVVPALVTLATDTDVNVRASAVHPLATIITTTTNVEVLDKIWLQLETLCDDPATFESINFQLALARTCSTLAHTAHPRLIQSPENLGLFNI
ncbi:RAB11-binding protein RELCH-like [Penaeus chinensis]|uniref:RAB11-binding protein RELCH-like n=1 Tax=Penaeus chinensis TaxID=139456 RepID=UPI001FB5947B|nr:RAB11-binding protein RELCH-like [Penaeus chinensis]XP_047483217.1 RAB11-binding protein RELCH-like [Penaeus chinensis]